MSSIKGCADKNCAANIKKIKFKKDDSYCTKCGKELVFVCHKCYEPVEDTANKYCNKCQTQIDERNEKIKNNAKKAVDTGKTIVVKAVEVAPTVISVANIPAVQKVVKPVVNAASKIPNSGKIANAGKVAFEAADAVIKATKK